jgi:phosphonate transport system ATP-binding protein
MTVFELDGEHASFNGKRVLSDISLGIERGEKIALVGKSGAGKSTLLQLLYKHRQEEVTLLPQELGLVKSLSVFHNVCIGRLHHNSNWHNLVNLLRPVKTEIEAVTCVLEKLHLADKIFAPVGELSGGQQQRTAVARSVFQGSTALLGDEPVSAVDEVQAQTVLSAIVDAHETVVLAMHDVDLALRFSNRIVGIVNGQIVMDRPSAGIAASDLHDLYKS